GNPQRIRARTLNSSGFAVNARSFCRLPQHIIEVVSWDAPGRLRQLEVEAIAVNEHPRPRNLGWSSQQRVIALEQGNENVMRFRRDELAAHLVARVASLFH